MRFEVVEFADSAAARGVVVVIDVLRAFTTAAYAFAAGARAIALAASIAEARELRRRYPRALLMGEDAGAKPAGFDLGNSPAAFGPQHRGKLFVQATGAGTRAARGVRSADALFAASFANAGATTRALAAIAPPLVTFVVSGTHCGWDGDEDHACAEYLTAAACGGAPDPAPYLARVCRSIPGRNLADRRHPEHAPADLACSLDVDRCDIAMRAHERDGVLWLEPP